MIKLFGLVVATHFTDLERTLEWTKKPANQLTFTQPQHTLHADISINTALILPAVIFAFSRRWPYNFENILPALEYLEVYVSDFNSHHLLWPWCGYWLTWDAAYVVHHESCDLGLLIKCHGHMYISSVHLVIVCHEPTMTSCTHFTLNLWAFVPYVFHRVIACRTSRILWSYDLMKIWKMQNVSCQISMSNVKMGNEYQMWKSENAMSDVKCRTWNANIKCQMSNVKCKRQNVKMSNVFRSV